MRYLYVDFWGFSFCSYRSCLGGPPWARRGRARRPQFFLASLQPRGEDATLTAIQRTLKNVQPASRYTEPVSAENIRSLSRTIAATARQAHSKEILSDALGTISHALRIARGEILVPELTIHQREKLLDATALRYTATIGAKEHLGQLTMSFVIPAQMSSLEIVQDLIIGCKGIQRKKQAVELENLNWLERHGTVPMGAQDLFVTVGKRMPMASNQTLDRQKEIAGESGAILPSRELATIMHSLAYFLTGRSIFEGFSAKLDDGTALNFSRRGLCLEFGQKVAMFSEVFPVTLGKA